MKIVDKIISQGNFLFRWRSFIPLLLFFPGILALSESALFEQSNADYAQEVWVLIGVTISMLGLFIRWVTVGFVPVGTSGRNTKQQRAEQLNTEGMYSIVKNPLYLGNYLALLGILVSLKVWWFILIACLAYWLYVERVIAAEENYLTKKFGNEYLEWANKTPIFVPNLRLWQRPGLSFSFKTVLKREYSGLMAIASAFFIIEFLVDVVFEREPVMFWAKEDLVWIIGFVFSAITFLTLRTLKKHTKFLTVAGR